MSEPLCARCGLPASAPHAPDGREIEFRHAFKAKEKTMNYDSTWPKDKGNKSSRAREEDALRRAASIPEQRCSYRMTTGERCDLDSAHAGAHRAFLPQKPEQEPIESWREDAGTESIRTSAESPEALAAASFTFPASAGPVLDEYTDDKGAMRMLRLLCVRIVGTSIAGQSPALPDIALAIDGALDKAEARVAELLLDNQRLQAECERLTAALQRIASSGDGPQDDEPWSAGIARRALSPPTNAAAKGEGK